MLDLDLVSFSDRRLSRRDRNGLVVDVGAASGDFSRSIRALLPEASLLLVEPDPESVVTLHQQFDGDALAVIAPVALADFAGSGSLNRYENSTQNSLLSQYSQAPLTVARVEIETLDSLLAKYLQLPSPIFVKVDTQGHDLSVLKGGLKTIRQHRPLVQVEVIFSELYDGQCSPAELFAFFSSEGYCLADMVMPHFDEHGRLAYADWIFTADPPVRAPSQFLCRDAQLLSDQIHIFKKAAEERLALVDLLHAACQERQVLIERLTRKNVSPTDSIQQV